MFFRAHILIFLLASFHSFAQKKLSPHPVPPLRAESLSNSCFEATAKVDLDVNNVRATIMNSADMWWNLSTGRYENPKGSGLHSIYVFGHNKDNDPFGSQIPNDMLNVSRYDAGRFMDSVLKLNNGLPVEVERR